MITKQNAHLLLIKTSFMLLTVYFFFALTNFDNIFLRSNYFLVFCLAITLVGFLLSPSFNWPRIIILSATSFIIFSTIILDKINRTGGHVDYDYTLIFGLAFFVAMGEISIKSLIKTSFYTQIFLTVITMVFFALRLLPNSTLTRGDSIRQSLGFSHPNLLGLVIMCLTIEFLYIYFNKINWFHWGIVTLINLVIYYITLSRTSFICSIAILLLFVIERNTKLLNYAFTKGIMLATIPILFVMGVFLPYTFNNSGFYLLLNKILSNRLSQGHYYLERYSIHLFGHPIPNTIKIINPSNNWLEGWVVDSSYLRILIQYGIIIFLAVFIFVFIKCLIFTKKGYMFEIGMVLICLFYGFFERYSYNVFIYTTPFLLLLNTSKYNLKQWNKMEFKLLLNNKLKKGA